MTMVPSRLGQVSWKKFELNLNAWKQSGNSKAIPLGVNLNFTLPGAVHSITGDNVATQRVRHS